MYGKGYSTDVARRMMYGSRKTLELLDDETVNSAAAYAGDGIISEIDAKMLELKKERQKFFDQRVALNKLVREQAREEELHEILEKCVQNGELPALDYVPAIVSPSDNDLLVSINDIHYGASVDNYWNKYNSDICRDMLCNYLDRIVAIAKTHGSENCIVWQNGDAISGNIHQTIALTNRENVIEQVKGVSELIAEFLAELSKHFATVKYVSVSGNHSRLNPNKEMSLQGERLDDLVEWYLSARLQNFDNIVIGAQNRIDDTMYTVDIRGMTYAGVHGEYESSPVKIQSIQTMVGTPIYAVLSGHMHHNKVDTIQGIKSIMAGSFLGMDDYCVKNRIFGKQEQLVCVCDARGVACYYDVPLQ